jgi:hypothetical protein
VAIPTDFKGFTPAAATTKTFKILGSATVGVWGCDVDGTFTPAIVPLAPNMVVFLGQAYTEAQIIAAMFDYIKRSGGAHAGSAGGFPAQAAQQVALTSTVTA